MTLFMNCNCDHQRCSALSRLQEPVVAQQRARQQRNPRTAPGEGEERKRKHCPHRRIRAREEREEKEPQGGVRKRPGRSTRATVPEVPATIAVEG